jgi:RND family efflux transporter MFP subunit
MGSLQAGLEFAGEVKPRVESRLGFRVGGKVVARRVEVGAKVRAGEVLAQLDIQDYKLAADAARAQVGAASTNRDLASADFKRYKGLYEQNFISSAELERRDAALKSAQSQLDAAQAQLSGQGNQAAYTTLVADAAGVVISVDAEVGQVVAAGTPVIRVAQDGPRDVVFSVPEDKVAQIKLGSSVDVQGWTSKAVVHGVVREVGASADPVTRTFTVKVALDAKDAMPLGTTVSVIPKAFDHSAVQVIKLPTSAFFQSGNSSAVWVLDPQAMTVKPQVVTIATADGNDVVVTAGLAPGMQVVSAGVHVLSPGQKVSIYQDKPSAHAVSPSTAASAPKP